MVGSQVKRTREKRGGKTRRGDFERPEQAIPNNKIKGSRHKNHRVEKPYSHTENYEKQLT